MSTIHKEVYGQGQTIVLIHGWAMHSGVWRTFARELAKNYQVICLDIPGHGRSEAVEPYTLEQISEVLIDEIAEPSFCLLGWSLGTSIALSMATRYPQRINSLILIAGNPKFVETDGWHGMPVHLLEEFAENLQASCQLTLLRFLALQVNGLADGKALLKQLRQAIYECDAPAENVLKKGLEILKQADLRENIRRLHCPFMLVLGDKDSLIPVQVAQDIRKIQANSVLNIIPGAGHVPFLSHQAVLLKMIGDFL